MCDQYLISMGKFIGQIFNIVSVSFADPQLSKMADVTIWTAPYVVKICSRCLKKLHMDKCEKVISNLKIFTSLDLVYQPTSTTVQVFRDAMKFKIKRKELSMLKTKLKLKKTTSSLLNPNFLRAIVNESLMIIDECYKVFEHCTLHRVNKKFKNIQCQNYMSLVCLYTSMLCDEISNKNLSEINKKRVIERKECLLNVSKKMIGL